MSLAPLEPDCLAQNSQSAAHSGKVKQNAYTATIVRKCRENVWTSGRVRSGKDFESEKREKLCSGTTPQWHSLSRVPPVHHTVLLLPWITTSASTISLRLHAVYSAMYCVQVNAVAHSIIIPSIRIKNSEVNQSRQSISKAYVDV